MSDDQQSMIRVALVDDDPYVRSALAAILSAAEGIELVGCFDDGAAVVNADLTGVDVLLMDIRMPRMHGIDATRELKRRAQSPTVIMLTTFDLSEEVMESLHVGAAGYLMKDTPPDDLVQAIRNVARGQTVLSSPVTRQLVELVQRKTERRQAAQHNLRRLTPREREVAEAISHGKSNAEICQELYIAIPTVKAQVSSIFNKLNVTSRLQVALLVRDATEG